MQTKFDQNSKRVQYQIFNVIDGGGGEYIFCVLCGNSNGHVETGYKLAQEKSGFGYKLAQEKSGFGYKLAQDKK